MDLSMFLDDTFDAKAWVNATFAEHNVSSNTKDQYASTVVLKLQKFIQEVNSDIEETSQQAFLNLPKVIKEIESVKHEAGILKEQMRAVKQDIQKVEHDTSQSMQTLRQLDLIKSRMFAASDALKEADNWITLSADIDDVFLSQDVEAMTNKLVGLQQSLQMLTGTVDYADRCQYLETLKNQLEAFLSPHIVSAFMSQSLEMAASYVKIFTEINRLPQLKAYYHKCRKRELLDTWKDIVDGKSSDTVVEWLSEFMDILLSTWHSQINWCGQVFSKPATLVCDLISDTLLCLDPTLHSLIAALLKRGIQPLELLIALKQVSDRFIESIENIADPELLDNPDQLRQLYTAVYAPFHVHINQYQSYEEETLKKELDKIPLDHLDILETIRLLDESRGKIFHAANAACGRCVKFTNCVGVLSLIDAYKTFFSLYASEVQRVLINIREKCKPRIFYLEEDWTNFQHCLRIIQTAGELIMNVEELEGTITLTLHNAINKSTHDATTKEKQRLTTGNLETQAEYLLEENAMMKQSLEKVVMKFRRGESVELFSDIKKQLYDVSSAVHKLVFDVAVIQVNNYLADLSELEVWTMGSSGGAVVSDLPAFGLSPQEYITKIGQYLLTLPQQLEPFMLEDNISVVTALKHGNLQFSDTTGMSENPSDVWLESIAHGSMDMFCEEILRIAHLTDHSTKQLIVDIEYLCNVLEDLGLRPSETLSHITSLLRATPEEFPRVALSMPMKLVRGLAMNRDIALDI